MDIPKLISIQFDNVSTILSQYLQVEATEIDESDPRQINEQ